MQSNPWRRQTGTSLVARHLAVDSSSYSSPSPRGVSRPSDFIEDDIVYETDRIRRAVFAFDDDDHIIGNDDIEGGLSQPEVEFFFPSPFIEDEACRRQSASVIEEVFDEIDRQRAVPDVVWNGGHHPLTTTSMYASKEAMMLMQEEERCPQQMSEKLQFFGRPIYIT